MARGRRREPRGAHLRRGARPERGEGARGRGPLLAPLSCRAPREHFLHLIMHFGAHYYSLCAGSLGVCSVRARARLLERKMVNAMTRRRGVHVRTCTRDIGILVRFSHARRRESPHRLNNKTCHNTFHQRGQAQRPAHAPDAVRAAPAIDERGTLHLRAAS